MKSKLVKLTMVLVSILVCLTFLEIAVRVFNLAQPRLGQADPVFGHSLIPGQKAVNKYGVTLEIGAHGFRGPAPKKQKDPGVFRVALLGDSFLFAAALEYEDVMHNILNRRFDHKGLPIEVLNFGVEAYSTIQEKLVYEKIVRDYQPDLVILCFYIGNDLSDNYPPRQNIPGVRLVDGELEEVPFNPRTIRRNPVRDFLRKNVRLYTFIPDLFRAAVNNRLGEMFSEKKRLDRLAEKQALYAVGGDISATISALKPTGLDEHWQVTFKLIQALNREVRADGAGFALIAFPTMVQVYDHGWKQMMENYQAEDTAGWGRFRPQTLLKHFAAEQGIEYIPLTPAMLDAARNNEKVLYLPGDYHFNEAGQKLTADILEPVIERRYLKKRDDDSD